MNEPYTLARLGGNVGPKEVGSISEVRAKPSSV